MKWEQQFGERVSQLRRERNLTRTEFGELVGLSAQYVGRIERGDHTISGAAIHTMCEKAGISADFILFGKKDLVYMISDFNRLSVEQAKVTLDIAMNVIAFLCTHDGNSTLLQETLRQHHVATTPRQIPDNIIPNSCTIDKTSTVFSEGGIAMDYLRILGERIRFYRKVNGITQIELAEKLGVAPRYIGNIEQGHRKPRLDMLIGICTYFGVGLSELIPMDAENKLSPRDKMIYEIVAVCRTLEMNQIGVVKSMVSAFNG